MNRDTSTVLLTPTTRRASARGDCRSSRRRWLLGVFGSLLVGLLAGCSSDGDTNPFVPGTPNLGGSPAEPDYASALNLVLAESDFDDKDEIDAAWNRAYVHLPANFIAAAASRGQQISSSPSIEELMALDLPSGERFPVAIWLHGCNGLWYGTEERLEWLASLGYVAIAPDSLARRFYPRSCDSGNNTAGLYRPTLQMRQIDALHALWRAHRFQWSENRNVVLGGFSEGAATVATLNLSRRTDLLPAARIIEAWVCQSGWTEFHGLAARPDEPVVALVALNDPWYRNPWSQGDCGEFMNPSNGSESLVIDWQPLRDGHSLLQDQSLRGYVEQFLISTTSQDAYAY